MATDIVQTIAQQVAAGYDPDSRRRLKFIAMDDMTLRVHLKLGKRVINTDITYDEGWDHYNVARHESKDGMLTFKTREFEGVYFDQLAGLTAGYDD